MEHLPMNIYLAVGIVLAFAFNSRREWLGSRPASPHDDGSESLMWFAMCTGLWPLMLASVVYAKTRKSLEKHRRPIATSQCAGASLASVPTDP